MHSTVKRPPVILKDLSLSNKTHRLNFCTVFETNYLSRGLALYESLLAHAGHFHLYIIAFNQQSYELLSDMKLEHATIISLAEFENEALLKVKPTRSIGEYCWTCTSSSILYCLDTYQLDHCIYLDADLYFFDSPQPLIDEMGDQSVLITEHRYTPRYDQSEISGKYCVQFMYFKNNEESRKVLNWWIDACIDWCFAKPEDGKFGDQKYLDDWCDRFEGVHELQHLGGGMAPWNVQQYEISLENGKLMGAEKTTGKVFPVIFYHFHKITFYSGGEVDLGEYLLSPQDIEYLYKPYIRHLERIKKQVAPIDPHGTRKDEHFIKQGIRKLKRKRKGLKNSFRLAALLE